MKLLQRRLYALTCWFRMSAPARTGTVLDRVVEARLAAVEKGKKLIPEPVLRMTARKALAPRDFVGALSGPGVNVIAELKKASPSLGVIRDAFDPPQLARTLTAAGAAALSVLTEEEFFQGSLGYLRAARKASPLPALRKDFIIDPWQVWESRVGEADAFLLIVATLTDEQLRALIVLGRELQLPALVEVHTREELFRALEAGAEIIGVNNRNLRTFEVNLETSFALVEDIPERCVAVCESGLRSGEDLRNLRAAGFDAFLIGEHLMKAAEPGRALAGLLGDEGAA